MTDLLDLSGRTALITGAGQGVGAQIAADFAAHGATTVIVNDYFAERAEATAEAINAAGGTAVPIQGDVTDRAAMKELAERVRAEHGVIDILVNNAGNAGATPSADAAAPYWETGPEAWDSYIGVNFYGVINATAAVVPGMIDAGRGRIVTIISEAARYGDAGMEIYAGAKAGAAGFTRSTARTLGRYGITANCVSIAATLTPAIEDKLKEHPEQLKKMMSKYVIRRPGRPADIANTVLFLASDAAEYITGQTYPVNGGFTFSL